MFNCPIKAPVSENEKVANLFLVGFVRYFIWFLFALSHIRQKEEQREDLPTEAWICIAIYSTGLLYCAVWVGQLCGANLICTGDIFRPRQPAFQFMVWSESLNAELYVLRAMEKYTLSCKTCAWKILFMNENRMGYRKIFGSRIWKRYFSHYLWLHLCIWNLSLCM